MKIIEFFGLPGCGKSECVKLLRNYLQSNCNYSVKTYEDVFNTNNLKKKCLLALKKKKSHLFVVNSFLFCLKYRILHKKDVLKRIIACLPFISLYNNNDENNDFLILDEGIIQGIVSAVYSYNQKPISLDFIKNILPNNVLFVYLDVGAQLSSKRIIERNTPIHGRCDAIQNEYDRLKILNHQKSNYDSVYNTLAHNYKIVRLHNQGDISETINSIVEFIEISY